MSISDYITLAGILVAITGAFITAYNLMSVKIAEVNARFISIQKELTEHKTSYQKELEAHKEENNRDSAEIKALVDRSDTYNRQDHGKLFDKFDAVSIQILNATRLFLSNPKV